MKKRDALQEYYDTDIPSDYLSEYETEVKVKGYLQEAGVSRLPSSVCPYGTLVASSYSGRNGEFPAPTVDLVIALDPYSVFDFKTTKEVLASLIEVEIFIADVSAKYEIIWDEIDALAIRGVPFLEPYRSQFLSDAHEMYTEDFTREDIVKNKAVDQEEEIIEKALKILQNRGNKLVIVEK